MAGGGKNEFIKKRDERDKKFFNAGMDMGIQMVHDFMEMALRNPKAVGKDVFGRARLEKLYAVCKEYDDYYHLAFTKHVKADKLRQEMDAVLKEIYGDDLVPFERRYPYAVQFGYEKPLKGWADE